MIHKTGTFLSFSFLLTPPCVEACAHEGLCQGSGSQAGMHRGPGPEAVRGPGRKVDRWQMGPVPSSAEWVAHSRCPFMLTGSAQAACGGRAARALERTPMALQLLRDFQQGSRSLCCTSK